MRATVFRRSAAAWVLAASGPLCAQAPAAPPAPAHSAAECQVWARELSFARSVAEHDAAAFAAHLHDGAAFGASRAVPTRGRAAIAERWAGIVEGKAVRLEWYPTRVTIGGAQDVAWSSGPSLFEDRAPDAPQRYAIGAFHSVWHRGADGVWRVLFDDGVAPKPATEVEALAFRRDRPGACPQG